jgi:hypothetical protein
VITIAPPETRFSDDQVLTLHREPPSEETQQAIATLAQTIEDDDLKASLMQLLRSVQKTPTP